MYQPAVAGTGESSLSKTVSMACRKRRVLGQPRAIELELESRPTAVSMAEVGDQLIDLGSLIRPSCELAHLLEPSSGASVVLGAGCGLTWLTAQRPQQAAQSFARGEQNAIERLCGDYMAGDYQDDWDLDALFDQRGHFRRVGCHGRG